MCAGIHYISIYDPTGCLEDSMVDIEKHLQQSKAKILGPNSSKYPHTYLQTVSPNSAGGETNPRDFYIQVSSIKNGSRLDMISTTIEICKQIKQNKLKLNEINSDLLHNYLKPSKFPDPDLMLYCGSGTDSFFNAANNFLDCYFLCGFSPWHIRLTELFTLSKSNNFYCEDFVSVLRKYSKTEQRYGT